MHSWKFDIWVPRFYCSMVPTSKAISLIALPWWSVKTGLDASEVVLCPILYCIDVFSTYLGKILDFVVVHWSFIFVSHVSRLIVEFIWGHTYIIVHAFAFLDTFFLLLLLVQSSTPFFRQQSRTFLLLCSTSQIFPCWRAIFFPWLTDSQTSPSSAAVWRSKHREINYFRTKTQSRTPRPVYRWKAETVSFLQIW